MPRDPKRAKRWCMSTGSAPHVGDGKSPNVENLQWRLAAWREVAFANVKDPVGEFVKALSITRHKRRTITTKTP